MTATRKLRMTEAEALEVLRDHLQMTQRGYAVTEVTLGRRGSKLAFVAVLVEDK